MFWSTRSRPTPTSTPSATGGEDDGQWYNSLKLYAEVVKTTKEVASADGIPFTWDDGSDSELKLAVDEACTAQQSASFFPAGCGTNFAVYVPSGVNYRFRPMNQTGAHIAAALGGNGGLPNPPSRSVWYYPARSINGQAAETRPQANDISAFYGKCQVANNERFIVLPVAPWIAVGGPSFGFRVTDDGASLCMAHSAPAPAP